MHTKTRTITTLSIASILITALLAWTAGASSSRPPAQPTAIATVDIMSVIEGLNERDVLKAELEARTEARQEQLNEVLKQLEALDADIQMLKQGSDEHREKMQEGIEMQALAKTRRDVLSQIVSIDNGTVMQKLFVKIETAIQNIAEREGYDIVLFDDTSFEVPADSPNQDVVRAIITKSLIYRHDSIDITQQVITLMNNEYSAP
ncbi:MAG: OmpH family outer membrane protein [Phycisphaerales bacterium]|nr:OmpH family outer membrane protein [Phycisphaerales bacterium]